MEFRKAKGLVTARPVNETPDFVRFAGSIDIIATISPQNLQLAFLRRRGLSAERAALLAPLVYGEVAQ